MKVGILTFHFCDNYGAVLQAFALQQTIQNLGIDVEIIDYTRDNLADVITWFKTKIISTLRGCPDKQLYTVKEFLNMVFKGEGNTAELKIPFETYRKKYLLRSNAVNKKNISQITNDYDYIIVGSDQVWNCGRVNLDTTYLLDFVKDKQKKISYAASFGICQVPEKYRKTYQKYISEFQSISVREKQGAVIVKDLIARNVEVVLDPTLLLKKENWINYFNLKAETTGYILLYQLGQSEKLVRIARQLSKEKELPVRIIRKPENFNGIEQCLSGISPDKWVEQFLNASIILTSSFHGVAFSINFEKEFYAVKSEDRIREAMESRLANILDIAGLPERYIGSYEELRSLQPINYAKVSARLKPWKEKSLHYLQTVLGEEHE